MVAPACVLEQDISNVQSTAGLIPRQRYLCPDIAKELLTGTVYLNINTQTKSMFLSFAHTLCLKPRSKSVASQIDLHFDLLLH